MKRASLQIRIGGVVRRHREKAEYSQESFADHIKMHRAYYGAIERGQKNIQLTTLERVCDGLEVRMWEVIRDAQTR
jgi:transcriptional regulator with XRE-family HTH domain